MLVNNKIKIYYKQFILLCISNFLFSDSPLDIGGSTITSYSIKIVQKDGGKFKSFFFFLGLFFNFLKFFISLKNFSADSQVVYNGPKRMCSVGGLEPGKEYLFSMQATNSAGVYFFVKFFKYSFKKVFS